ncbi:MAG: hypothetical protein KDA80_22710 [Planctomycetaceae bacterium]|nr:hypothetical protein [Planctomycetaceae bacterium]
MSTIRQWIASNRPLLLAAFVSFLGLPACIFVHELGHYAVARAYGWQTTLFPAMVTYTGNPDRNPRLLFLLAGPLIDLLQIGSGIAILWRFRHRRDRERLAFYWVGVILTFVSVKWVLTPLIAPFHTWNDERQISTLIGCPPMVLPGLVLIPGLICLSFLIRQHLRHGAIHSLVLIPAGGLSGAGLWINLLGPWLLGR